MRNKRLMNQIAAVGGAICLALTVLLSPATTVSVQAAAPSDEEIMPCRDVIEWRFMEVSGSLYRRLYNYGTNSWIGDWEYIGPAY